MLRIILLFTLLLHTGLKTTTDPGQTIAFSSEYNPIPVQHTVKPSIALDSPHQISLISFFQKKIHRIRNLILNHETRRGSLLETLIPILSVIIVFLMLNAIAIFGAVYILKAIRSYRSKRKDAIAATYLRLIADYLVNRKQSEYPIFPKLQNALNRNVLIAMIYQLSQDFFGKKQNKMLKLFRIRLLLKHVLFRIAVAPKAVKATYLKLFSVIILNKHLKNKFYKYLFSKHHEVRLFTQLAYLNYQTNHLGKILRDYPYILTTWDQIHFLEVIDRRSTIPPDFYPFLESSNDSVIIFGLRMIRIFYQKGENEHQIIGLLSHPNEDVRYEALKTATDLNIETKDKLLLAYLSEMDDKYKALIVKFLIQSGIIDEQNVQNLFYQEKNDTYRLIILETIYNCYSEGQQKIEQIRKDSEEENVKSMCTHILENAI